MIFIPYQNCQKSQVHNPEDTQVEAQASEELLIDKELKIVGNKNKIDANDVSFAGPYTEISEYLGIPYAAKPIGLKRWTETELLSPFEIKNSIDGKFYAQKLANACPQEALASLDDLEATKDIINNMSEDCLYLNIWSPSQRPKNTSLPVMVWFHGGGFVRNSIRHPKTFGDVISSHGVVVVTVDYRLGPLGFFGFPGLNEQQELTGNYGLIDMINSLKWVQKNISYFGGDPQNVTIFGTSAGGASVNILMSSPYIKNLEKPLFHKAISQSGGGAGKKFPVFSNQSGVEGVSAQSIGADLWNQLKNDSSVTCSPDEKSKYFKTLNGQTLSVVLSQNIHKLSELNIFRTCVTYKDILRKVGLQNPSGEFRSYPFVDGKILSASSPLEKFRDGETLLIPYIGGATNDEASLVSLQGKSFDKTVCSLLLPKSPMQLMDGTPAKTVKEKIQSIGELYNVNLTSLASDSEKLKYKYTMRRFFGDMQFSMPSRLYGYYQNKSLINKYGANSKLSAFTYEYGYLTEKKRASLLRSLEKQQVEVDASTLDFIMSSAGHSQESFSIFGKLKYLTLDVSVLTESDHVLSLEIIKKWVQFAASNDPNNSSDKNIDRMWEPNSNGTHVYEIFSMFDKSSKKMDFYMTTNKNSKMKVFNHFIDLYNNPDLYKAPIKDCEAQLTSLTQ